MSDETYKAEYLHHPGPPSPRIGYGRIHPVSAAPDTSLGDDGDIAIITTTGVQYIRSNGTWTIVSGGGGGGFEQVIAGGEADPNGTYTPADPTKGAIYTRDGAGLTQLWRWDIGDGIWVQITG